MKLKQLILLNITLFAAPALAQDFDLAACLSNHPIKRTVYRDQDDVVRCVNFGGKKAVEYKYNSLEGYTIGKQKLAVGALVGKKFYGFEGIPEGELQSAATSLDFYGGVLKNLFKEVNQIKPLDQLIREYFPDEKKQNEFIDKATKEYLGTLQKEIPAEFEGKTLIEKLNFLQNEINENNAARKNLPVLEELTFDERVDVRVKLTSADRQKMSISECNPAISKHYNEIFSKGMISKSKMENDRLLAETNIFDGKIKIVLGTFLLDNLLDKTIEETKPILANIPKTVSNETVNLRYNKDGSQDHDFPELPVISRVLVHELGHVHQFAMLKEQNSPYELYKLYVNVAGQMAKPEQFSSVPKKLKNQITSQILEPLMGAFEYSAESYFVDAVPCIL